MAARVFVASGGEAWKLIAPKRGSIGESLRFDHCKYVVRNADTGDDDLTAVLAARQKHMPRLAAEKRDGAGGLDYVVANNLPCSSVEAARYIH